MTLDMRALGFLLFLIAAGFIIYAMSGPQDGSESEPTSKATTTVTATPWALQELVRAPAKWETVRIGGRPLMFESYGDCHTFGKARAANLRAAKKTVRQFRCMKVG